MKIKPTLALILSAASLLLCRADAAVTVCDFSNFSTQALADSTFDASWTSGLTPQFVQNANSISITSVSGGNPLDTGDFLVSPANPLNLSGLTTVALTASADSGNQGTSLLIYFYDGSLNTEMASFTLSNFGTTLSTQFATLTASVGFDPTNVVAWQVAGGGAQGSTSPMRVSLQNLAVTTVPEPSTYALLALGTGLAGWIARRKKA